jgi:DNA mismatch endonuclease (patch repair protein)
MDHVSSEKRSAIMAAVKSKHTRPELIIRRLIHKAGFRYRLHDRHLPGSPDIVFRSRRSVVFVHGCFWHGHAGCPKARLPLTRPEFWSQKVASNRRRDRATIRALRRAGWGALVVWQCQLRTPTRVLSKITKFLERSSRTDASRRH